MRRHDLRYATSTLARSMAPVALALAVGALAAYAALGLVALIQWTQALTLGIGHNRVYSAAAELPAWRVLAAPAGGGLLVGLIVYWLVPGRRNHGPADVMEAVRVNEGRLDVRSGLSSAAASAIAIGSGASLGRYGPSVHLGASIAAWLGQAFKLVRAERLTLIGCGVAAAISASFSAPLAGVLFAHEVVLDAFARRGFVAITIASVTGQVVAHAHGANFALASLEADRLAFGPEFLLFAVVGVAGGLTSIAFIRGLEASGALARRIPLPAWLKPALAGLLVGVVALRYPQVLGLGDAAIHDAVEQLFALPLLVALLAAKLVVTCACRGLGVPGGVFGPSLFLGAMLGSAVGQSLALLDPALVSSVSAYAVAGMGAVISCVIGAPLTTILIVFELTGSYALASAVMVAVVVASMVTSRLFPYSWFNLQLLARGVDLRVGREVRIMRRRRVSELMTTDFHTVASSEPIAAVRDRMMQLGVTELLVVDADRVLDGQVSLVQVLAALADDMHGRPVGGIAAMPGVVLMASDSLDDAMQRLRYFIGASVPVVSDPEHNRIEGVVFGSSVIGAYNDAVDQARREERGDA